MSPTCVASTMPRAPADARAGDWACPSCKDVQFARNPWCRKCGREKPDVPAGSSEALASALVALLSNPEVAEGLCCRSDGFVKLDEALSVACMQGAIEQVAPGSAAALNTACWGGPVSRELYQAVNSAVAACPQLEYYDASVTESHEVWLRFNGDVAAAPTQQDGIGQPTPPASAPTSDASAAVAGAALADVLARALASVLRNVDSAVEGLIFRPDGFAKLDQALSVASIQQVVEQVVPGSAEALNSSGWGGPVSPELRKVADAAVAVCPQLEFWDPHIEDSQELWIRFVSEVAESFAQQQAPHGGGANGQPQEVATEPASHMEDSGVDALAHALAQLLQHPESAEGLIVRPDGFAKLDEALSVAGLQTLIELVAPGSSADLSTPGWGGPVSAELRKAVDAAVEVTRGRQGCPQLEFYDPNIEDSREVWIRVSSGIARDGKAEQRSRSSGAQRSPSVNGRHQSTGGGPPAHGGGGVALLSRGKLRSFDPEKGFGFLACSTVRGGDVFLHANAVIGEKPPTLSGPPQSEPLGPEMEFRVEWWNGRPRAIDARLLAEGDAGQDSGSRVAEATATGEEEDGYLPPHLDRLSRALATLLRHRAAQEGLALRDDGFTRLSEALAAPSVRRVVEEASVEEAAKPGADGVISPELMDAVHEIVVGSTSKGRPRFELSFEQVEGADEFWIRATHKHTLPNVHVPSAESAPPIPSSAPTPSQESTAPPAPPRQAMPSPARSIAPAPTSALHSQQVSDADRPARPTGVADWLSLLGDSRRGIQIASAGTSSTVQPAPAVAMPTPPATPTPVPTQLSTTLPPPLISYSETSVPSPAQAWATKASPMLVPPLPRPAVVSHVPHLVPPRSRIVDGVGTDGRALPVQAVPKVVPPPPKTGTPAQDQQPQGARYVGRLKTFHPDNGFGFVDCPQLPGVDIFVHSNWMVGELPPRCKPGSAESAGPFLEFDLDWKDGRPRAMRASVVPGSCATSREDGGAAAAVAAPGGAEAQANGSDVGTHHGSVNPAGFPADDADRLKKRAALIRSLMAELPTDAPDVVREYLSGLVD